MKSVSWDDLRCLVLVAQEHSLSGAARELGVSVATLGRRIDCLEAALGTAVLRRTPQGAKVTVAGQRIVELIKPGTAYFEQLGRLRRTLIEERERPPVRISSTEPMIADVLAPHLPELYALDPNIRIELEASLELSDLNRGDADIAIRMVRPKGDTLITRRLPRITMGLFASTDYLNAHPGALQSGSARLIWYDRAYGDIAENVWLSTQGLEDRVALRSGSVRTLLRAAEAGVGIAPLPEFLARRQGLLRVDGPRLPDREPWLVFHRDTKKDPALKTVRDWIVDACTSAGFD